MDKETSSGTARDHSGDKRPGTGTRAGSAGADIAGWGVDLDHKDRPAYPMERTPARLEGVQPERPEDQPLTVKVYHSVERPGITPVFGTSTPPSGISGMVRGLAFKLSENDIRHWLLLLLADRINVVEGVVDDVARGHIPNIFAEMGIRSEWQHNRAGLVRKAAIAAAVGGVAYLLVTKRRNRQ